MLEILFLPRFPHDFLSKLLCKISFFWAVSGRGTPLGPLFFLVYFSFFHFRFLFEFLSFLFFFFFIFYSFLFLLFSFCFPLKNVSSFFILFLFFLFSTAQNLWRHSGIPWGEVHILSWLYLLCLGSSSLFPVE